MYDAIIVGARCAGSPTAMLLARRGYKVLVVDKSKFPSDTISTHCIWAPGTERLKRWGLLEKIGATGCPVINRISFDVGPFALSGSAPPYEGVSDVYAPRRTILDKILIDAAAEAGAEVRQGCAVDNLVFENGKVTGIRCSGPNGLPVTEKAKIVVGADGRNSIVARIAKAEEYGEKPKLACWCYTYWSGIQADGIEFYVRPQHAIGVIPTNDGMVCLPIASPQDDFDRNRSDPEGAYMNSLSLVPELAERVRAGKQEERYFGTGEMRNFFRKPYGPGWALVGDAGYHKDPIGAQGISDAFRDAELLAEALDDCFCGRRTIEDALADYHRTRDEHVLPMYQFNSEMAALQPPPPEMQQLFGALRGNQPEMDRFFGALTGTVPIPEFFSPANTERIMAAAV